MPLSQCSPNLVQPMPTMATWSLIPCEPIPDAPRSRSRPTSLSPRPRPRRGVCRPLPFTATRGGGLGHCDTLMGDPPGRKRGARGHRTQADAMSPIRVRLALVALGVMGLLLVVVLKEPPKVVDVTYAVSPDAVALVKPMIREFNELHEESDGQRIRVTLSDEDGIAWARSCSRSLTGRSSRSCGRHHRRSGEDSSTPGAAKGAWPHVLFRTSRESPQVIVIFTSSFQRLSLTQDARLEDVLDLVARGDLKLAHTDPNISTSGRSAALLRVSSPTESRRAATDAHPHRGRPGDPRPGRAMGARRRPLRGHRGGLPGPLVQPRLSVRRCRLHAGDDLPRAQQGMRRTFTAIYPTDVPLVADMSL